MAGAHEPMTEVATRADVERLDAGDPLGRFKEAFDLPDGVIYLDGNSLGPLPKATPARLEEVARKEWGGDLIKSWDKHGWMDYANRLGDKIARLIGAGDGEVVVADSTSINLYKVLSAALRMRPGRTKIVSEIGNFPTDLYIAQGLTGTDSGHELRMVEKAGIVSAIDDDTAVVSLTQVDYRTGEMHDMAAMTEAAHAAGAIMVWDLSHSAGAVPVDLNAENADMAVGCGYKYLNGGPGAPAYLFVAERHQNTFEQPLSGWIGHARPFDFLPDYEPADGVSRYLCGTPGIIAMAALEVGVDLMVEADMSVIRKKSIQLSELFIKRVEATCGEFGLELISPRSPEIRGSQAGFTHSNGYPVMQALIERGVIGDFRAPDILRFGFTPLYLGFADVWDAVEILREVLASGVWTEEKYSRRGMVT